MIVLIAGMQRSGSTYTFNVARELLKSRGTVNALSLDSFPEYNRYLSKRDHLIVKSHLPCGELNQLVLDGKATLICSLRKPENAVASWMRIFGVDLDEAIGVIQSWLAWHQTMKEHSFNIEYSDIDLNRWRTTEALAQHICPDVQKLELVRIWWKYRKRKVKRATDVLQEKNGLTTDIGFSFYNNENFFHRNHIGSIKSRSASDLLTSFEINEIRRKLSRYVDENGDYI